MVQSLSREVTGLQPVKIFPAFHGTRRFITALTSVRHLSLSWASPIQSIYPHPTSWRPVLILSILLRLGLPSCLFPSGFLTKTILYLQQTENKISWLKMYSTTYFKITVKHESYIWCWAFCCVTCNDKQYMCTFEHTSYFCLVKKVPFDCVQVQFVNMNYTSDRSHRWTLVQFSFSLCTV